MSYEDLRAAVPGAVGQLSKFAQMDVQEEQLFYLSYATLTRFHTIWINIYRYGGLTDSDRVLIHEIAKRAEIRS